MDFLRTLRGSTYQASDKDRVLIGQFLQLIEVIFTADYSELAALDFPVPGPPNAIVIRPSAQVEARHVVVIDLLGFHRHLDAFTRACVPGERTKTPTAGDKLTV